jgi:hypothetical protein
VRLEGLGTSKYPLTSSGMYFYEYITKMFTLLSVSVDGELFET